jgi:hypothetical protein
MIISQRYDYDQNGNRSQITFGSASYVYTLSATSNHLNAPRDLLRARSISMTKRAT